MTKTFTRLGPNGKLYSSTACGTLGGKRYGRLDCRAALQTIARRRYLKHRGFILNEAAAIGLGCSPCAVCTPQAYVDWKRSRPANVSSGT